MNPQISNAHLNYHMLRSKKQYLSLIFVLEKEFMVGTG